MKARELPGPRPRDRYSRRGNAGAVVPLEPLALGAPRSLHEAALRSSRRLSKPDWKGDRRLFWPQRYVSALSAREPGVSPPAAQPQGFAARSTGTGGDLRKPEYGRYPRGSSDRAVQGCRPG